MKYTKTDDNSYMYFNDEELHLIKITLKPYSLVVYNYCSDKSSTYTKMQLDIFNKFSNGEMEVISGKQIAVLNVLFNTLNIDVSNLYESLVVEEQPYEDEDGNICNMDPYTEKDYVSTYSTYKYRYVYEYNEDTDK